MHSIKRNNVCNFSSYFSMISVYFFLEYCQYFEYLPLQSEQISFPRKPFVLVKEDKIFFSQKSCHIKSYISNEFPRNRLSFYKEKKNRWWIFLLKSACFFHANKLSRNLLTFYLNHEINSTSSEILPHTSYAVDVIYLYHVPP